MTSQQSSVVLGATPYAFNDVTASGLAAQASFIESCGYDSFWLPESHFGQGSIPDPLMWLASVASHTERLRLATTSYLLPLRHPLQAAEQVAVLDRLSGGRVTLGIGRGYQEAMFAAYSVDRSRKRQLFEWCLDVMRKAWSGEPVSLEEGAEPVVLDPLPVQQPLPIWVAAFGPKALAQAGRLGLPHLASPMETLTSLERNYGVYAEAHREAHGADNPVVAIMRSMFVTDSATEADRVRSAMSEQAAHVARRQSDAVEDWAIVGDRIYVRDKIDEYRDRLGVSDLVVTRLRIQGMAPDALQRSLARVAELTA